MDTTNFSFNPQPAAKLLLHKFPSVEFTSQRTPMPSIRAVYPNLQFPRIKVPQPIQSIEYSPFSMDFILFEDCSNYRLMVDWLQESLRMTPEETFSDGSLMLLSSNRNVVQTVTFTGFVPVALGEVQWVTTANEVHYQTCNMILDYTLFHFKK